MTYFDALVTSGLMQLDVPLAPLTTYKFGGPSRYFAEVSSSRDLSAVIEARRTAIAEGSRIPILILGRGSNLAVADGGFDGLTIRLGGEFNSIEITSEGEVVAGGAAPVPQIARRAAKEGRGGLEFLVGIPGSVGGAVQMNAGCLGSETADWLINASVMNLKTGSVSERSVADLGLSYRHSNLTASDMVTSTRWRTVPSPCEESETRMREITTWRKEAQPGGTLNAGSVFKNPPGVAAGKLIDDVGLKGLQVGKISVSTKHANFFVADSGATAQDLYGLVHEVRRRVGDATGIWLDPEVRFVGIFESADPEKDER